MVLNIFMAENELHVCMLVSTEVVLCLLFACDTKWTNDYNSIISIILISIIFNN